MLDMSIFHPLTRDLVDSSLFIMNEHQSVLSQKYTQNNWEVSLAEENPHFLFDTDPAAVFRVQFLGSTSGYNNTWMWGWNNINNYADSVVSVAKQIEAFGQQHQIPEFTNPILNLEGREDSPYVFLRAAGALSGYKLFYRAPTGDNNSYAWFLIHNADEIQLGRTKPHLISNNIMQSINEGLVSNHLTALTRYVEQREGLELQLGVKLATLQADAGTVELEFDDQDRISRFKYTISDPDDMAASSV